eukprot:ctg_95.g110
MMERLGRVTTSAAAMGLPHEVEGRVHRQKRVRYGAASYGRETAMVDSKSLAAEPSRRAEHGRGAEVGVPRPRGHHRESTQRERRGVPVQAVASNAQIMSCCESTTAVLRSRLLRGPTAEGTAEHERLAANSTREPTVDGRDSKEAPGGSLDEWGTVYRNVLSATHLPGAHSISPTTAERRRRRLDQFEVLRLIGKGAFGGASAAQRCGTGALGAQRASAANGDAACTGDGIGTAPVRGAAALRFPVGGARVLGDGFCGRRSAFCAFAPRGALRRGGGALLCGGDVGGDRVSALVGCLASRLEAGECVAGPRRAPGADRLWSEQGRHGRATFSDWRSGRCTERCGRRAIRGVVDPFVVRHRGLHAAG